MAVPWPYRAGLALRGGIHGAAAVFPDSLMTGPKRRLSDHVHPEYWKAEDHHRFEDRMTREIETLEKAITALTNRITLLLGGLILLGFAIPVIAPFIRSLLGVPVDVGP